MPNRTEATQRKPRHQATGSRPPLRLSSTLLRISAFVLQLRLGWQPNGPPAPGISPLRPRLAQRQVADFIQIADVNGTGYIGRVTIIEKMVQSPLSWDRTDHIPKTRHL